MLVTDFLKQFANIEKNVVIVGVYDRLEIWEESAWEKYKKQTEKDSNKIAENLTNLGI
jgi:MraZ protein